MGIRIFISRLDVHFIISYARKLIYQNIIVIELSKTIRGNNSSLSSNKNEI